MRFISSDNKIFDTQQECEEHEAKIESATIKARKLKEEKENRRKIIYEEYNEFVDRWNAFVKDYDESPFTLSDCIVTRYADISNIMRNLLR